MITKETIEIDLTSRKREGGLFLDKLTEKKRIGIVLALVGGFLDAYTFAFRGGVFANAQTGNIVLFSISVAKGDWYRSFYYIIPIVAFFIGVVVSEYLKHKKITRIKWQHLILGIEAVILFLVGGGDERIPNVVINVTISFVCSLQVNSFRKLHGMAYATTMCTGNLRSASEQICQFLFDKKKESLNAGLAYLIIIAAFCTGAALGVASVNEWKEKAIWFCSLVLLLVMGILINQDNKEKRIITTR